MSNNRRFPSNSQSQRGQSSSRSRGRSRNNNNRAPPTCYQCHQQGHFSRDCPMNNNNHRQPPQQRNRRPPPPESQRNAPRPTGRGRGRGSRGRGRGRPNGNQSGCFRCGQQGHFSRDCPMSNNQQRPNNNNYRQNNNNYHHRNNYNNNNQYNRPPAPQQINSRDPSQRFSEPASQTLIKNVDDLNSCDSSGAQGVKVVEFMNGWQLIESLSTGTYYYFSPKLKKTSKSEPAEFKEDRTVNQEYFQPQGSSFTKPPSLSCYAQNLIQQRSIPIITNAYHVNGAFLHNTLHRYHITFDPEIPTQYILQRRRAFLGSDRKQQKLNRAVLNNKFGRDWTFDNNDFVVIGGKALMNEAIDDLPLCKDHKVIFRWTDTFNLDGSDLEVVAEAQIMNTFSKNSLKLAGFKEVRRAFFYRNAMNPPKELPQIKPTKLTADCTLLHGFKVAMSLNETQGGLFKADLANKQISSKSVHEIINDVGLTLDISSAPFRQRVKEKLEGHFFIMSYNSESRRIETVEFRENEHSQFELRNGSKISYAKYLKQNYEINVRMKEICVLKDDYGNAYLPQFAYLTLRSDEIADLKDTIQQYTNPPIGEILSRSDGLVKVLNKAEQGAKNDRDDAKENNSKRPNKIQHGMEIREKAVSTEAVILNYPDITIRAFDGDKTTSVAHDFKWGGREGTKGFLGDVRRIKKWVIVGDNQRAIGKVHEIYGAYIGMRGFRRDPPLFEPEQMRINLNDPSSFQRLAKGKYQLIFLILPDGKYGSEVKTRATKALQSQHTAKNSGILLQCMSQSTIFGRSSKDSILGAIEQAMGKYGQILYRITPKLPPNTPYHNKLDRIWTIGIDVSHGGVNTEKPSVCVLCLQTMPFYGTQRGMRNFVWLNSKRKDVIPFQATVSMGMKALTAELSAIKNEATRPEIIMVFRDGAPDNALKEIYSKEFVGIERAIHEISGKLLDKDGIKWRPKVQFIVVSKDPMDKFGTIQRGKVVPITRPCVVFKTITSPKLWDFFLWNYHPNCDVLKIKPKRYVVLKDGLKLGKQGGGKAKKGGNTKGGGKGGSLNQPMALYEIIYALSFCYHPSLPFIQGGTSQPSPIKFAKHFAEKFSQLITKRDQSVNDLKLSRNLKNQPQIITNVMKLEAKKVKK